MIGDSYPEDPWTPCSYGDGDCDPETCQLSDDCEECDRMGPRARRAKIAQLRRLADLYSVTSPRTTEILRAQADRHEATLARWAETCDDDCKECPEAGPRPECLA